MSRDTIQFEITEEQLGYVGLAKMVLGFDIKHGIKKGYKPEDIVRAPISPHVSSKFI